MLGQTSHVLSRELANMPTPYELQADDPGGTYWYLPGVRGPDSPSSPNSSDQPRYDGEA